MTGSGPSSVHAPPSARHGRCGRPFAKMVSTMSPAHISLNRAGDLVASLGSPQFPARLWAWLRETVDPQSHYSVATRYRRGAGSQAVDVLFFAGGDDPGGTRHALDLYTQGDWRNDTLLPHIERVADSQLVFSCNEEIDTTTEYGRQFALGDLGEDCTLLVVGFDAHSGCSTRRGWRRPASRPIRPIRAAARTSATTCACIR